MRKIRQAYHSLEAFQLTDKHIIAKAKLKKMLSEDRSERAKP